MDFKTKYQIFRRLFPCLLLLKCKVSKGRNIFDQLKKDLAKN